jgi:RNA polymerase sigma-70 factor (ECF subfamily)
MTPQSAKQSPDWPSLLEASRSGDDEAFGEICDRLTEYLLFIASSRIDGGLRAKFGASDVVQQAFLEARQDFASFRGTSENEFRAWLVRLVQHNLIDSARRFRQAQKRHTSREVSLEAGELTDLPGSQKTASSIVRHCETDDELLRAVAQLPARRRKIIELRNWQELSFAEVGKELGLSDVAARILWSRTVEELRRKVATIHDHRSARPS